MIKFRADLHCHSICSDGSDSPVRLLQKAKEAGLQGLSITDHDTIDAYTPELFSHAESFGIALVTGVEISSEFEGTTIHILGYGFDLHSPSLREHLREMQARRADRNRSILEKLAKREIFLEEEDLVGTSIGRPHIAALMVKKGYVKTHQEAFDRYLKEGGSCYVGGFKYTPGEVIEEIHKAHGKAILAHPHFLKGGNFLRRLLSFPFDGFECYYAGLPKEMEMPWVQRAKERNLIATGGSDYHGSFKPQLFLGASWVGKETFESLLRT